MQLASDARIPDGLLAANALLSEKPRLGVPSCNPAPHPGFELCNSFTAMGVAWSPASETRQSELMGRFLSPDPTFLNIRKVFNPQRWNLYSYALNSPLANVDPDGNETIAVVYPNYQTAYSGQHTVGAGHAGVVIVDKDGTTHYFEYGRYTGADGKTDSNGLVRSPATPSIDRDAAGNITPDSMNKLLGTLSSQSGKGGTTDALIVPTNSTEDDNILAYLKAREAENGDPNRQKYSLLGGHNCGTLACEALGHGGVNVPPALKGLSGDPYNNWFRLWAQFPNATAYQYQPKEHITVTIHFDDQLIH